MSRRCQTGRSWVAAEAPWWHRCWGAGEYDQPLCVARRKGRGKDRQVDGWKGKWRSCCCVQYQRLERRVREAKNCGGVGGCLEGPVGKRKTSARASRRRCAVLSESFPQCGVSRRIWVERGPAWWTYCSPRAAVEIHARGTTSGSVPKSDSIEKDFAATQDDG